MAATPPLPTGLRHVILDRDGVLNEEAADHGYILRPADFKWLPGALEALLVRTGKGLRAAAQLCERGDMPPVFNDLAQIAAQLNPASEPH